MPIPTIYLKIVLEIIVGTKHKSNCRLIAKREEAFFSTLHCPRQTVVLFSFQPKLPRCTLKRRCRKVLLSDTVCSEPFLTATVNI